MGVQNLIFLYKKYSQCNVIAISCISFVLNDKLTVFCAVKHLVSRICYRYNLFHFFWSILWTFPLKSYTGSAAAAEITRYRHNSGVPVLFFTIFFKANCSKVRIKSCYTSHYFVILRVNSPSFSVTVTL